METLSQRHNSASALRCIGQTLQHLEIEAFELKRYFRDFRLLAGDPNPPYTALIELNFSPERIEALEREGQGRRGQSNLNLSFDSLPEMLRAIGEYIDNKQGRLRRIDNSCSSTPNNPIMTIEYETRTGDLQTENLTMSSLHDASVRMYRRRRKQSVVNG